MASLGIPHRQLRVSASRGKIDGHLLSSRGAAVQ
jgi:hypothetical protein